MERVEEERQCFGTILSSLQHAVLCYRGGDPNGVEPLTLAESREFMELAGQLLGSEVNPARLDTLLFSVSPPLLDVLHFIMTTNPNTLSKVDTNGFTILQTTAVANIGRVVTLCCDEEQLKERLRKALEHYNMVDVVCRYLGVTDEATRQTAMETLFFMVTKLDMVSEVVGLKIIGWLCGELRAVTNPVIRDYGASILHKCSEMSPQDLANEEFVTVCLDLFEEPSMGVAVGTLLCKALVRVLDQFPQGYWQVFDSRLRQRTGACCVQLLLLGDMVPSVCSMIQVIAVLEAALPAGESEAHFVASLLDCGGAEMLVDSDAPDHHTTCLTRMKTLLLLCESCVSPSLIDALSEHLFASQRALSILLAAPLKLPPFHPNSEHYSMTASVVIALLCAKHERARQLVSEAIRSYPGWVNRLDSLIVENIEKWLSDETVELSVVDSSGVLLNATSYVDLYLPSAWYSVAGMREAAKIVFRDTSKLGATSNSNPGEAIAATLTPSFKRMALTLAVLTHAITLTFGLQNDLTSADVVEKPMVTAPQHQPPPNFDQYEDADPPAQWENEDEGEVLRSTGVEQQFEVEKLPRSTSNHHSSPSIRSSSAVLKPHLVTTPRATAKKPPSTDIVAAWREARPLTPRNTARSAPFNSTVSVPSLNNEPVRPTYVRKGSDTYRSARSPTGSRRATSGKQGSTPRPWR